MRSALVSSIVLVIVTLIITLPFLNRVSFLMDEGILLHGAQRMLRGEIIYRDFFEVLPPFGFFLVSWWMRFVGDTFVIIRLGVVGIVIGIAVLTYHAALRSRVPPRLAILLVIGWIVASQGYWTVMSHHWIATLLLMGAAILILHSRIDGPLALWCAVGAGLCTGAAGFTVSHRGATSAIAFVIILACTPARRWAKILAFLGGTVTVPIIISLYLAINGAIPDAFDQVVLFAASQYSSIQYVPFGAGSTVQSMPLPLAFVLLVALVPLSFFGRVRTFEFRDAVVLAVTGFMTSYPRADSAHLGFTAPFILPALGISIAAFAREKQFFSRLIFGGFGGFILLLSAAAWFQSAFQNYHTPPIQTPRGPISTEREALGEAVAALVSIPIGEPVYFYPTEPLLAYLAHSIHSGRVDVMLPGYSTPEQYNFAEHEILSKTKWVFWNREASDPEALRGWYPTISDPNPPEKQRLESVITAFGDPVFANPYYLILKRR